MYLEKFKPSEDCNTMVMEREHELQGNSRMDVILLRHLYDLPALFLTLQPHFSPLTSLHHFAQRIWLQQVRISRIESSLMLIGKKIKYVNHHDFCSYKDKAEHKLPVFQIRMPVMNVCETNGLYLGKKDAFCLGGKEKKKMN